MCEAEEVAKQDIESLIELHTLETYKDFMTKSDGLKKKSVNGKNTKRYAEFVEEMKIISGEVVGRFLIWNGFFFILYLKFKYNVSFILIYQSAAGTSQQNPTEDGDIEMEDSIIPELDPITKKRLKIPVRNKICNHIYEKNSIVESLKISRNLR